MADAAGNESSASAAYAATYQTLLYRVSQTALTINPSTSASGSTDPDSNHVLFNNGSSETLTLAHLGLADSATAVTIKFTKLGGNVSVRKDGGLLNHIQN